jgi:hypothetical protein
MTQVRQALRFALDPTVARGRDLGRHTGAAWFCFNWGPDQVKAAMEARQAGDSAAKLPTAMSLHRQWNSWKRSPEGIA